MTSPQPPSAVFAVTYTYDGRSDVRAQVRPEHRSYLARLVESGELLASGPYTGPTVGTEVEPDGALLLFRAAHAEAVAALLDADPFVREGLVARRSVRPWEPLLGAFS